jgi:hypothetical protein
MRMSMTVLTWWRYWGIRMQTTRNLNNDDDNNNALGHSDVCLNSCDPCRSFCLSEISGWQFLSVLRCMPAVHSFVCFIAYRIVCCSLQGVKKKVWNKCDDVDIHNNLYISYIFKTNKVKIFIHLKYAQFFTFSESYHGGVSWTGAEHTVPTSLC